uniref:Mediator of RNA polymerase II transcription subunit 30 n=1 Tax=Aceria tosichella TaxID=561515 RepID=A0A6G1S896_9ACAR
MAHESDNLNQGSAFLSGDGLYHCRAGQDAVHEIVAKATELFNQLKTTNAALQRTAENDAKRAKIIDILSKTQKKFDELRNHYDKVNEICSSLAYVQVKSLIPFKDDPDNVEQIQKHRRNLYAEPHPDIVREKELLKEKIALRDEQLRQITNDLRDFIYEINTMLHVSKSQ